MNPSTPTLEEEAIRVVQRQVELYNLRDLDRFMTVFTEDAQIFDGWTGKLVARGVTGIRPRFQQRFLTPVRCRFIGRLVLGNIVVDREVVSGLPDGTSVECLAVYTVNVPAAKISKCVLFWGQPPHESSGRFTNPGAA